MESRLPDPVTSGSHVGEHGTPEPNSSQGGDNGDHQHETVGKRQAVGTEVFLENPLFRGTEENRLHAEQEKADYRHR